MSVRRFLLVAALTTLGGSAHAQAKPPVAPLEARLTQLAADVELLRVMAAEVPTLQKAIADALAELKVLREMAEGLEKGRHTSGHERARVDALEARATRVAEEVATLRATVQAELAPEARARAGGIVRYDDGFVLEADGGRFTLRAAGYLQLRYALGLREDPLLVRDDRADSVLAHVRDNGFALRRARLALDGGLYDRAVLYRLELELSEDVVLKEASVAGLVGWGVRLEAGLLKVPFARTFLVDARALSFPERSVATDEFRYDRDLGVTATWQPQSPLLQATVGVFNGTPSEVETTPPNVDPLLVLRLGSTPLGAPSADVEEGDFEDTHKPSLTIGLGLTFENAPVPGTSEVDLDRDGAHDNVRVVQASADVAFRWRRLGVEAEGYARMEAWGGVPTKMPKVVEGFLLRDTYWGGVVQASYFVLPQRFQLGARASYSQLSPLVLAGKTRRELPSVTGYDWNATYELSALAAYYRHRRNIALQGLYTYRELVDLPSQGEHRVIVQSQVAF
jgi:hypothetical protein